MRSLLVLFVACATSPIATTQRQSAPEAAYAEACGMREYQQITESPLARHGLRGRNTSTGAIVELAAEAGAPITVLADLRCHRAWTKLSSANAMAGCPLELPGLRVDVRAEAGANFVELSIADPTLVSELQRRVAEALEHRRHHQKIDR